jgi:dTMP kinase
MSALTELLLYEASRSQHVAEVVGPALSGGAWVVSDRFADASTAYQGMARDLGMDMVIELNSVATGGLRPDLTIVLDLPVETGLDRLGKSLDRIEGETADFHRAVRRGYLALAECEPERVRVIDASAPVEEIAGRIREMIEHLIQQTKAR